MAENIVLIKECQQQQSPFDAIRQIDETGIEFWSARGLMPFIYHDHAFGDLARSFDCNNSNPVTLDYPRPEMH